MQEIVQTFESVRRYMNLYCYKIINIVLGGRCGRDHMVVGFTTTCLPVQSVPIATKV